MQVGMVVRPKELALSLGSNGLRTRPGVRDNRSAGEAHTLRLSHSFPWVDCMRMHIMSIPVCTHVGIQRFGEAHCPLDEALSRCVIDISGRPSAHLDLKLTREKIGLLSQPYHHQHPLPNPLRSIRSSVGRLSPFSTNPCSTSLSTYLLLYSTMILIQSSIVIVDVQVVHMVKCF